MIRSKIKPITFLLMILFFAMPMLSFALGNKPKPEPKQSQELLPTQEITWKQKQSGAVESYIGHVAGSPYHAFWVKTKLNVPIITIYAVFADVEVAPEWIHQCEQAKLLQPPDKNGVFYTYLINKLPWPVKPRDMIVKGMIEYEPDKKTFYIRIRSTPNYLPEQKGYKRLHRMWSDWRFTVLGPTETEVELIGYVVPKASVPVWLVNLLVLKFPEKTIEGLGRMTQLPKYQVGSVEDLLQQLGFPLEYSVPNLP